MKTYNNLVSPDARFDGIHLNVEAFPSGGAEPTTPEDLDMYARAVADAGVVPVSASISHHWENVITYNELSKEAYKHILDIVAGVDVQTAQDDTDPLAIEIITKEGICYAASLGKPVQVTLETYDVVTHLHLNPFNTFFEEGEARMEQARDTLDYRAPGVAAPCLDPLPTGFAYHFYRQSFGSPDLAGWEADLDGDGIVEAVDTRPETFSEDFSDGGRGGLTSGTITNRGTQTLRITDAADSTQGGFITALSSGGATPATLSACNGAAVFSLAAGAAVHLTCSSVTLEVVRGVVVVTFLAADGSRALANLAAGNGLRFDPAAFTFSTLPANGTPVDLVIGGEHFLIAPGKAMVLVVVDIKPDSFPNTIKLGSGGTVPVAIFSTMTFAATAVDPTRVTLASAPVRLKGQGTPMAAIEDVDGDGLDDLILHVSTEALQLSEADTVAVLRGQTFDGTLIRGADTVRIVP